MLPRPQGVSPFALLLRQSRLNADLTQAVLAEKAGLSTRAIQHLEAGQGQPYTDSTRRLADALGLAGEARAAFESLARRAPRPRLARAEPRTRSDSPGRHNLPTSVTSFIGRAQETAELQELLTQARLLTLVGVGGCGKSRLALEVAGTMVERFPDGVWLIELAPLVDSALVPHQVASVLGVSELPGQPIVDVLVGALRERSILLVLDNCEHVLTACSGLVDSLVRACPQLHIMATSRSVLGVLGETIWRVPSLSLPDEGRQVRADELARFEAARLFVERAQAAAPSFSLSDLNADAVARICWRLEGIPLGLELAAARVPTLGVAELATRLDDCLRLLVGGGSSRPARQQTLRAAVDWSYDLLTPSERDVFVSLSVFAGGCTLEAGALHAAPRSANAAHRADCPAPVQRTSAGYRRLVPTRQAATTAAGPRRNTPPPRAGGHEPSNPGPGCLRRGGSRGSMAAGRSQPQCLSGGWPSTWRRLGVECAWPGALSPGFARRGT
jgi:transcriptional regulator with XRE-family HTH domain